MKVKISHIKTCKIELNSSWRNLKLKCLLEMNCLKSVNLSFDLKLETRKSKIKQHSSRINDSECTMSRIPAGDRKEYTITTHSDWATSQRHCAE